MKIAYGSDLHLEFDDPMFKYDKLPEADVMVLAGDICVWDMFRMDQPSKFLEAVEAKYEKVFFVLGNHEHYHGQFNETATILENEFVKKYPRITLLDGELTKYKDVLFIGGTLWTEIDEMDFGPMIWGMNDYRVIRNGNRMLHPTDTNAAHSWMKDYIEIMTNPEPDEKCVVITHHAPSYKSMHPKYAGDTLNAAFLNNMDDLILERPNVKLWIHGHTHDPHEYTIGETKVVCNPKGYPKEFKGRKFEFKVVEV